MRYIRQKCLYLYINTGEASNTPYQIPTQDVKSTSHKASRKRSDNIGYVNS